MTTQSSIAQPRITRPSILLTTLFISTFLLTFTFATTAEAQSLWEQYADSADQALGVDDFDKALDYLTLAIDAHPNTAMLDNYDYSRDFFMSEDLADLHEERGNIYFDRGEYDEAATDLTNALYFDDFVAERWYKRATIWNLLRMPEAVITDLDEAILRDSSMHAAWALRGVAKIELKEYKGAADDLTQAIALAPLAAEYYEERARAWQGTGKEKKAKADEQKALTLRNEEGQSEE